MLRETAKFVVVGDGATAPYHMEAFPGLPHKERYKEMRKLYGLILVGSLLCVSVVACGVSGADEISSSSALTSGALPGATGWGDPGVVASVDSSGNVNWNCVSATSCASATWHVLVPTSVGDAIASLTIPVRDNGFANGFPVGGNTLLLQLISRSASGASLLGSITSNGSGNPQTMVLSITPRIVAVGETLVINAIALNGVSPATVPSLIGQIQVTAGTTTIIRPFFPKIIVTGMNFTQPVTQSFGSDGSVSVMSNGGGSLAYLDIPYQAGETLVAIDATVYGNGSTSGTLAVGYLHGAAGRSGGGSVTLLGGLTDAARTSDWASIHVPMSTLQKIADDGYIVLTVSANNPGYRWGEMRATFQPQ